MNKINSGNIKKGNILLPIVSELIVLSEFDLPLVRSVYV